MAELTERELKITHLFLTMLNHKFESVPMDIKQGLLKTTLALRDISFDEKELLDLVAALNQEQELIGKNALGLLAKQKIGLGDMANLIKGMK